MSSNRINLSIMKNWSKFSIKSNFKPYFEFYSKKQGVHFTSNSFLPYIKIICEPFDNDILCN